MLFGWITPAFAGAGASFDAVRPQPAGQPEAVAPGFISDRYPLDIAPRLLRVAAPAMEQPQQSFFVRGELLYRLSLDPRDNGGDGLLTASELTGARLRKYITAQAHVRSIRQAGIAVILKFALRASVCNFVTEPSIPPNHVRGLDPR